MPPLIRLLESEKRSVLDLHKEYDSHQEIAEKINRSKTVGTNFLKDPVKYGSKNLIGRKIKVDERTKRLILRTASNKSLSCAKIIQDLTLNMARWTINRVTNKSKSFKRK